jgi:hypothetical protein
MARNGTHVTPTLSVHWTCDLPQDAPHDDLRFRYVSQNMLEYWQWATDNVYLKRRSPQESVNGANCSSVGCASPGNWRRRAFR